MFGSMLAWIEEARVSSVEILSAFLVSACCEKMASLPLRAMMPQMIDAIEVKM